jgi:hypothetical protein
LFAMKIGSLKVSESDLRDFILKSREAV